jgi:hypothetical protein
MIGGLIAGLIYLIKSKFKLNAGQEGLTIAGFTITYVSLASSNYQLPHYIYVVLPLLAIMTAKFIYQIYSGVHKLQQRFTYLQYFLIIVLAVLPGVILWFVFPTQSIFIWILALLPAMATMIFLLSTKEKKYHLISASLIMITFVNIFLSGWFYPELLNYQSGNMVGRKVDELNIAKDAFYTYNYPGSTRNIHFYSKRIVTSMADPFSMNKAIYVLTGEDGLSSIKQQKNQFEIILKGEDYPVSQLTPEFLNVKTRTGVTKKYYLVKTYPKP